jgi:hypothetical protein
MNRVPRGIRPAINNEAMPVVTIRSEAFSCDAIRSVLVDTRSLHIDATETFASGKDAEADEDSGVSEHGNSCEVSGTQR